MKERGHNIVRTVVDRGCVVPAANLVEALKMVRVKGYRRTSDEVLSDLIELGLEIEPLTEDDVLEADWQFRNAEAKKAKQPGIGTLSLGDAICLAVAKRLDLPVVVSDGTWEVLDPGVEVVPFR